MRSGTCLLLCAALLCPAVHADYEDGLAAAQAGDYATALREFTAAAEAGLDLAQYNLATMYETGEGVAQDLVQAHFWASAAQYNEFADASGLLERLSAAMTQEQLAAARQAFAQWLLAL